MKIIDILNDLSKGKTYKFKYKDDIYKFNKNKGIYESTLYNLNVYYIDLILNDEVEVIEEKKEIEELKADAYTSPDVLNKINEVIRAVKKINKQLEEQETEDIDTVERELNKMF